MQPRCTGVTVESFAVVFGNESENLQELKKVDRDNDGCIMPDEAMAYKAAFHRSQVEKRVLSLLKMREAFPSLPEQKKSVTTPIQDNPDSDFVQLFFGFEMFTGFMLQTASFVMAGNFKDGDASLLQTSPQIGLHVDIGYSLSSSFAHVIRGGLQHFNVHFFAPIHLSDTIGCLYDSDCNEQTFIAASTTPSIGTLIKLQLSGVTPFVGGMLYFEQRKLQSDAWNRWIPPTGPTSVIKKGIEAGFECFIHREHGIASSITLSVRGIDEDRPDYFILLGLAANNWTTENK
ncbi:MAG: hypothetical protein HY540_05800 [Deltaproteobacteria bacterium]|nr:hypothetical protein [Deltaproteobacteria bacterium]